MKRFLIVKAAVKVDGCNNLEAVRAILGIDNRLYNWIRHDLNGHVILQVNSRSDFKVLYDTYVAPGYLSLSGDFRSFDEACNRLLGLLKDH